MRICGSQTYQLGEHLQQVEALLDPIRYDRSIDDAERRHLIDEVLAAVNARALSLHAANRHRPTAAVSANADVLQAQAWHRELARTG
jgi:hypothetical protein